MKKVLVGVAAALALMTSNAAADGVDRRPPPVIAAPDLPPLPSWTGFYIGIGVGGGAAVHGVTQRDEFGPFASIDGIGGQGVFGTTILGWDWQVGPKTVFGVFVDYDFSDISTDFRAGDFRSSLDHDHSWSVGGRLGFLTSPSVLWYATGGYTEARFGASARLDDIRLFSDHHTFQGWFAGAGVDTRLALTNWFLRLEYRFTQFDHERFAFDDFPTSDIETSIHTARATLTYKFTTPVGAGWNAWGR